MEDFRKILAAQLGRQQKEGEAHPEADLLTAFMEARLGSGERKSVVAHLAVCAECRQVVALAAGNMDKPAFVKEMAGRWWNLSWAAALAAACVAGVVVWHSNNVAPVAPVVEKAEVKLVQPAASATGAKTPRSEIPRAIAVQPAVVPKGKTQRNFTLPMATPGIIRMPEVPPDLPRDVPQKTDEIGLASGAMAMLPAPAPSPQPAPAMALRNPRAMFAKALVGRPRPQSLWAIASSGMLQKSDDGGRTWRSLPIGGQTNFLTISASGSNVWAGGEGGALFHSMDDGAHWTEVPVMDGEKRLAESISGIETQGSNVRVLMKSARWISSDGGVSWHKEE